MGVPVATPLTIGDWLAAWSALMRGDLDRAALDRAVREMLGVPFARCIRSGRAALYMILQAMRHTSTRNEVVIPAFVCPSVGRAVVKAGLRPVLCDVTSQGFGLDLESLERVLSRNTLAVVAAHLYGYPSDVSGVVERAHRVRAMVIEDAAQAFGARIHGRYAGTAADAGIFSFGMSKVLGVTGGGVIVTSNPELRRQLQRIQEALAKPSRWRESKEIARMAMVGMLVRRRGPGLVGSIWGRKMRAMENRGSEDFEVTKCLGAHAAAAQSALERLEEITRARAQNAAELETRLVEFDGIGLPETTPGAEPVFLRFPVVVKEVPVKKELLRRLHAKGIGASEMYTRSACEALRELAWRRTPCPSADYLSERMLNLPTHPCLRKSDVAETVAVFAKLLPPKHEPETAVAIA